LKKSDFVCSSFIVFVNLIFDYVTGGGVFSSGFSEKNETSSVHHAWGWKNLKTSIFELYTLI